MTAAARDTPLDPTELDTPVGKGGESQDKALVTARQAKAVALRLSGLSYEQVATEVGYYDRGAARLAVMTALKNVQAQNVEELRELEGARLDRLQAAVWRQAMQGDVQSVRAVIRISERRSKLLGLDAPLKVEWTGEVDAQLGELRAAMAEDGIFVVTDVDVPVETEGL